MSQHFLLSARARTLSLATVLRMRDQEAEDVFARIRWSETDGKPVCPHCEGLQAYACRRGNGTPRFRCKACRKDFTITSGTLFAFHKMPLQMYLAAIAIFCNEVKGKSALALARDLGTQYKTAFVLAHKIREAMGAEIKGRHIGGLGKVAEIDGAYFGGYIKPANLKENRRDLRRQQHQNGKRQCVVVIHERHGYALPSVFPNEASAISFIRNRVEKGTEIQADESHAWNILSTRYAMKRVNHQEAYSLAGACTNNAEAFFSRLRRGEIGHHHHIAGLYLGRYAQEAAWRDDHRRTSNGDQVQRVLHLAMKAKPSVDFCGYWQRNEK